MADSTDGNISLPEFEKGKTYLLTGETLQQICDVIRVNKLVLTGNVQFEETGANGSKLALESISLAVCIDGVTQIRRFLTLPGTGQPAA